MRRALALLAIALLAGLAAWRLLSDTRVGPPARSHSSATDAPKGPSVTTVPSTAATEAPPAAPTEPPPAAPADDKRPARVHGTVYTMDGAPKEAEVQIGAVEGRDAVASAHTAQDGTYALEAPAGVWYLCAFAPGWIAWPDKSTLVAGEEYEVDLYLDRGAIAWGWVIGPDASPLPGVVVLCAGESGEVFGRVKSDANGQYRLTVPCEWCTVSAESAGLAAAVQGIEPDPGQEVRVDLRLGEPRRLSGRVVDEEGRPVPGAAIELSREFESGYAAVHPSWRTEADAKGAFSLDSLPEAAFSLSATAPSFLQTWIEAVKTGGEDLVVVLRRGARVTGQVVRKSDGGPVESPKVRAVGLKSHATAQVELGEEGRFTLTAILPGDYVVVASAEGLAPGVSAPFTVGADGVIEGIRVELSTGGMLRGLVLDESTRRPVAQAHITTRSRFGTGRVSMALAELSARRSAVSDANGRFELPLLAPGRLECQVTNGAFMTLMQQVEVLDGRATEAVFLMKAGGAVDGVLRANAGGPALATGGRVCLRGERMTSETHPKPDGSFLLQRLAVGTYRLFAFQESPGRTSMSFQEVEVRSGEVARIEMVPGGAGRLSGRVRPPSGVSLHLRRRGVDSMVEIEVDADASGAYELLGAPPGEYDVRVGGLNETITLPEGDYDVRRDFDLPLDPGR